MNISKIKNLTGCLIILLGFLISCGSSKPISNNTEPVIQENPELLFVNYLFYKEQGRVEVELINQIKAEGTLKDQRFHEVLKGDYIVCQQLSENKEILSSQYRKNPFVKSFESINDQGEFQLQQVDLQEVELPFKLQLHPQTKYIVVSLVSSDNQTRELLTHQVP